MRTVRIMTAVAVAIALVAAFTGPSSASEERVVRRGSCSGGPSDWELDLREEDDGILRVKLEIYHGRSGQEWHIFLSDNGKGFFAGSRISGADGYVKVVRQTPNQRGDDTVKFGANNVDSGEHCSGKATI